MAGTRNLCAPIPIALHEKVCEERDKAGLTNGQYITALLTEYYEWKENGGDDMAKESGETRTLAVQIPAELADRIDEYLEQETKRRGRKLTKKDFITRLVENALNEAAEALRASSQTADDSISENLKGPESEASEASTEPEDENSEAHTEPEDENSEAPTEPEDENSEPPTEPEDDTSEPPTEPEDDTSGTPAEPEDDDGEAPTEPEAETSEDPDEDSQQEDGETGGDDDEVQTAENA